MVDNEQRSFNKPDSVWDYSSQKLKKVDQFISLLEEAKKPVVISGAGVRSSGAVDMLEQFVEKLSLPLVNSYGGKDTFSYAYDNCHLWNNLWKHARRESNPQPSDP